MSLPNMKDGDKQAEEVKNLPKGTCKWCGKKYSGRGAQSQIPGKMPGWAYSFFCGERCKQEFSQSQGTQQATRKSRTCMLPPLISLGAIVSVFLYMLL